MLRSLRVKNLAIVENIRIGFDRGLNVITGETGAGKSVLIGALGLILGERADKALIRSGENECVVDASFELADPSDIDSVLDELGIDPCDQGNLIVRRIVAASGAGRVIVNDCPATVQALKKIGDLLVDMHGPHDHQSLLSRSFQLDLLDSFGHLWKRRAAYETVHEAMRTLQAQLHELDGDDENVAQQIDLLDFQVKEIEAANVDTLDEDALEQEHTVQANAQEILAVAGAIQAALTEGEQPAFDPLAFAQNRLSELARILPEAEEWRTEAASIAVQVQELSASIDRRVAGIEADAEQLQMLEDQKAMLHKLKRKYGGSLEAIREFHAQAAAKLDALSSRGERIAALQAQAQEVDGKLRAAGRKLSSERRSAADGLAKAITGELRDMGFPHGRFDVALQPGEPDPTGMDEIEFGFAPNVGEAMRPLRLIASSGEISRVMLATKAVLASHDRIPVLVFDEIDANVGGEMGNAVGEKLATVAGHHQVLCITHLPQVAVHGTTHLMVEKQVRKDRTHVTVGQVEGESRTEEVARMLGGRDLTSVTLKHAREMIRNPRQG